MQEADGQRLHTLLGQLALQSLQLGWIRGANRLPRVDVGSLLDAETERRRDQRASQRGRQVVELRAVLAADKDQIGEAFGGDESGPCALALEQRVGGHRRSVDYFGAAAGRGAPNTLQNHGSGSSRIRTQLEALQAAVVMEDREIGERASCVNADTHR